ncbi:MAG: AAC(3) family N-acetyltransferase [Pseudomonadota bacterium]
MGLAPGDSVFVHTALGQIGHVIGGPRGLIEALIDTVGETGLIGMPGFSRDAYDPLEFVDIKVSQAESAHFRGQVPGFDIARSDVRANGIVAETFRTWPGVVRSPHPTSSVLLLGPDAAELAVPHDAHGWATGPETPWGRLQNRQNMKILLIGVGWNRCSALHAAETLALHKRTKQRHLKTGPGPDAPWVDAPDVADDLDTLFPLVGQDWENAGSVTFGKIGNAHCRMTGYAPLLDFASQWFDRRNKADGVPPTDL